MKKVFLFLILFFGVFGLAKSSEAACTGSSPTWTTTPDYASVSSCVSQANPGDTVNVGAGSATWSQTLHINKSITLQGTGIGNTVITHSGSMEFLLSVNPSDYANDMRITGFSFNLNSAGSGIEWGAQKDAPFIVHKRGRIDNNRFYDTPASSAYEAIWDHTTIRGVINNNIFDNCQVSRTGDVSYNSSWWDASTNGDFYIDQRGLANGNTYWEDNIINLHPNRPVTICQYSGWGYVFRYNTINSTTDLFSLFENHGNGPAVQPPTSPMYSCFNMEIYGNEVTYSGGKFYSQRGGRAYTFDNYIVAPDGTNNDKWEEYADSQLPTTSGNTQNVHDSYDWNNWMVRNGIFSRMETTINTEAGWANGLAENTDFWQAPQYTRECTAYQTPYSCCTGSGTGTCPNFYGTSGVGCGTFAQMSAITTCTPGVGYWATNQSCTDLTGMVGAHPSTPISGTLYKCTATNTWTAYYTPLPYPHPLRSGSTPPPPPPPPPPSTFSPNQPIQAEAGTLSGMQTSTSGSDTYIYTDTSNQGSASYTFTITTPGPYKLLARVNSNNDPGSNSFYVGLDNEAANGSSSYTYDTVLTPSFTWDDVNRRGNGTTASQYDPMVFTLTQGTHTFTFYGKEANTQLDQIELVPYQPDTTAPAAPTGLVVQ